MRELVATIRSVETESGRPLASWSTCRDRSYASALSPAARRVRTARVRSRLRSGAGDRTPVNLPHPEIFAAIRPGHTLLIDDGKLRLIATETGTTRIVTRVVVGGKVSNRKGVSLPDTVIPVAALTPKDIADLEAALDTGIDWVALSFIQRPEDIAEAKKITRGRAAVMAKIEKPQAVARLADILDLADALMVAAAISASRCRWKKCRACKRK